MEAKSFSWVDYHWITQPGSDQGKCQACWAFHSAQVLTDRFRIRTSPAFPALSPSTMIKSTKGGCCGGSFETAMRHMKEKGIPTMCCNPYTVHNTTFHCNTMQMETKETCDTKCMLDDATSSINTFFFRGGSMKEMSCPPNSSLQIIRSTRKKIQDEIKQNGPVVARLQLKKSMMSQRRRKQVGSGYPFMESEGAYIDGMAYKENSDGDKPDLSHGIAIVGWGETDGGIGYWLLRNSWGVNDFDAGMIRIAFVDEYEIVSQDGKKRVQVCNKDLGIECRYSCKKVGVCGGVISPGEPRIDNKTASVLKPLGDFSTNV